jgi:hypothetical protein
MPAFGAELPGFRAPRSGECCSIATVPWWAGSGRVGWKPVVPASCIAQPTGAAANDIGADDRQQPAIRS